MIAAPRFSPFLRLPTVSEHLAVRSVLGGNYSRFHTSDSLWQPHPNGHRNLLLSCQHNAELCQVFERRSKFRYIGQGPWYSTQKVKEDQPASKDGPSKEKSQEEADDLEKFKKLSLYQKVKAMYRDYWYVLVPVHLASSAVFLGAFYYAASSGVDIIAIMESLHFSEKVVGTLRDSSAGYIAIAYALYKIFTPIRYTVTLGGTTWAIKFLKTRGLIKPRPVKEAKESMHNIISAMKLPEKERQKFLEEKGMPRIGKAVGQASSAVSNLSNKSSKGK